MSAVLEPDDLQSGLLAVESLLDQALQDRSPLVTQLARHTAFAGGKRIRPLLCLLAGRFGRRDLQHRVARVAAGLEVIHLATLVHDDVVDKAATRRGRPTLSALHGNGLAVLSGDFLFAIALDFLQVDEEPRIARLTSTMVRELCAGAIEELELAGRFSQDLTPYYDRIYRKTAVFLQTACRIGALASGAPEPVAAALAAYGRRVGLAFQIIDDLLDFTGDPATTGKPLGADLRTGMVTLPMILGTRDPAVRRLLDRSFGRPRITDTTVRRVAAALEQCGALAETRGMAMDLTAQARQALLPLQGRGPVEPLLLLAEAAVTRDR